MQEAIAVCNDVTRECEFWGGREGRAGGDREGDSGRDGKDKEREK